MRLTSVRAVTVALIGCLVVTGASHRSGIDAARSTVTSMEYLGTTYSPASRVPIFRNLAADIIVRGQFVDLSTGVEVRTTGGGTATGVSVSITDRQSSRITVRVAGGSAAELRAYRVLIRYAVETSGPDQFEVTLFENGIINSLTITQPAPVTGTNTFAVGQVLSLRVQGSGLLRATLLPASVLPTPPRRGLVVVDSSCNGCTDTDRTFKIRFDSAGVQTFNARQSFFDGTLGFVPNFTQCGPMCYGGTSQLSIVLAVASQVASVTPANPAFFTDVILNGSGLRPNGFTPVVRFLTRYRSTGASTTTTVNATGTSTALKITVPQNARSDSIRLLFQDPEPGHDEVLSQNVAVPAINVTGEAPQLQRVDSMGPSGHRVAFIKAGPQVLRGKHLATGSLPVLQFGSQQLSPTSAGYSATSGAVAGQTGADSVAFSVPFPHVNLADTMTRNLTITTQTGSTQLSSTVTNVLFVPPPSVATLQSCQNTCIDVPLTGGTLTRGRSMRMTGRALVLTSQQTLVEVAQVKLNGVSVATSVQAPVLLFTVPQTATSGPLTVTNAGGTTTLGNYTAADPAVAVDLAGISLSPNNVAGGQTVTATIAINGTVPAGGIAGKVVFGTTSPDTAVQLPSGLVSINSNPFVITIPTRAVATQRTVGIRVSTDPNAEPSDQVSANLVLRPPALTSLAVNRPVVTGGEKPRGVARLDTGAPAAAAIQVSLTSSDPTTATVPPSVVMTGDSAVFTVTTSIVPTDRPVTITASAGGQTRSVTLTVKAPVLVRVNVLPDSIIPGVNQATASLAISGDFANPQTASVSCDAALVCPSSVAIPAGRPKVEFPVSASPVPAKITVPLSVTLNGVTQSASVRLKPLTLESIVVSPDTVNAGVSTSLTIELNAPVPSGQSLTVSFTSSDPSIVPAPSLISFQGGDLVKLRNVTTLSPQSQLRTVTLTATLTQPTSSGQNVSSEPVRITVRP